MDDNISIEIAKQLKDLGLHAFSLDYWVKPTELHDSYDKLTPLDKDWQLMSYNQGIDVSGEDADGRGGKEWTVRNECEHGSEFWEVYHAYSFSEIRAIVPSNVAVNENVVEIGYKRTDRAVDKWGKLLVYLLKNNMITVEGIKEHYE